ncbi:MAG TPA: hypothetical protein VD813_00850 [Pseudonocardia sp.]|nr:hypothetical protein [Pseudonocardia sp.]
MTAATRPGMNGPDPAGPRRNDPGTNGPDTAGPGAERARLAELLSGFLPAQLIQTFARLGIAEALADGPLERSRCC